MKKPPPKAAPPGMTPALAPRFSSRRQHALATGLLLLISLPWWLAVGCPFIAYDDPEYVTGNAAVLSGLNADSIRAAFTSTWGALWSPVTFLSLMLDVSLFGTGPAGMHATNVVLHIANALLLYGFLVRALRTSPEQTRDPFLPWRCLLVAAIFLMHPLRVESVAWVTERKDVLAAFFGLLAMHAYISFTRATMWKPRTAWYAALCALFALSLMSKPMLSTLPALLILLDAWPLNRIDLRHRPRRAMLRRFAWLGAEKLPLLAIAAAMAAITMMVQRQMGALMQLQSQPLSERLANVSMSYALYLRDHIYFEGLALHYPMEKYPALHVAGATALLLAITAAAALAAKKWPRRAMPALVGWLWFLGVLVPMIGLVQTGEQARADRYTYFPSIGLAIAVAWLLPSEALRESWQKKAAGLVVGGIIVALAVYTTARIMLWREPLELYLDGIARTRDNGRLEYFAALEFERINRPLDAIDYYRRAVFHSNGFSQAYMRLGSLLVQIGQEEEGWLAIEVARRLKPGDPFFERTYQELRDLAARRTQTRPQ